DPTPAGPAATRHHPALRTGPRPDRPAQSGRTGRLAAGRPPGGGTASPPGSPAAPAPPAPLSFGPHHPGRGPCLRPEDAGLPWRTGVPDGTVAGVQVGMDGGDRHEGPGEIGLDADSCVPVRIRDAGPLTEFRPSEPGFGGPPGPGVARLPT